MILVVIQTQNLDITSDFTKMYIHCVTNPVDFSFFNVCQILFTLPYVVLQVGVSFLIASLQACKFWRDLSEAVLQMILSRNQACLLLLAEKILRT